MHNGRLPGNSGCSLSTYAGTACRTLVVLVQDEAWWHSLPVIWRAYYTAPSETCAQPKVCGLLLLSAYKFHYVPGTLQ